MFQGYTPKVFHMEPCNVHVSFSKGKRTSKKPPVFCGNSCFSLQGLHLPENFVDPRVFEGKKTKIDHTNSIMEPVDLPPPPAAELAPAPFRGRLSRTKTVAGSD